mmetsp:Transcript_41616/g.67610  ORF Transcript_41616/g.67610 Transcript_41616/m.67610 type:complete len:318 (+) Transcript_41616:151-1104(+)
MLDDAEQRLRGGRCKQLWEDFPGNNMICCRGLCLTGPDPMIFIFNLILTFGILSAFYILIAIRLHPVVFVIGFILHGLSLYFLLRCAFTDPGIMKRGSTPQNTENPPTHIVNGQVQQLVYCNTCHIFRPPKCKHCRTCNNCVEEFDHHCPWVMNCVGKRNYRYFVGFVATISILCVYVCACCLGLLIKTGVSGGSLPTHVVLLAIVIILVTGCLGCTLSGFAGFHCRLIAQGMTTNEYLKGRQAESKDNSCIKNCCNVYCTGLPKANIDLRGPADIEMKDGANKEDEEDEISEKPVDDASVLNSKKRKTGSDVELGN